MRELTNPADLAAVQAALAQGDGLAASTAAPGSALDEKLTSLQSARENDAFPVASFDAARQALPEIPANLNVVRARSHFPTSSDGQAEYAYDPSLSASDAAARPFSTILGSDGRVFSIIRRHADAQSYGIVRNSPVDDIATAQQNSLRLNAMIAEGLKYGKTSVLDGDYVFGSQINVSKAFMQFRGEGRWAAADDFVGDWLVRVQGQGGEPYYRSPTHFPDLHLDARFKTRGLYLIQHDHTYMGNVRIERAYGSSLRIDQHRESSFHGGYIINGAPRIAFASPTYWEENTNYAVGQYARQADPEWNAAIAYTEQSIVRHVVGGESLRWIALSPNIGFEPTLTITPGVPLTWMLIPHEDWLSIKEGNIGKPPQTFNANNNSSANRYWQKVYQDEATLDLNDQIINTGDRSNQLSLFGLIIRDTANACYIRADSTKLPNRPITHFNLYGVHIHGLPTSATTAYPQIKLQRNTRQVEIAYAVNTNIDGCNIVNSDAPFSIGVLFGDGSLSSRRPSALRLTKTPITTGSTKDNSQMGLLTMPSALASPGSRLDITPAVSDYAIQNLFDPNRVFREQRNSDQLLVIPAGYKSSVIPAGYMTRLPKTYTDARLDPINRYDPITGVAEGPSLRDWQVLPTGITLRLGDGSVNPINAFNYRFPVYQSDGVTVVTPGLLQLAPGGRIAVSGGTFDAPVLLGAAGSSFRLWNNAGAIFSKKSDPTSAADGQPLMRKVTYPNDFATSTGSPGDWAVSGGGTLWAVYTGDGTTHSWVGGRITPVKTSVSVDLPSVPAGGSTTTNLTVSGVASGDRLAATFTGGAGGMMLYAEGIATDTVRLIAFNPTGAAIDLPARTLNISVIPS